MELAINSPNINVPRSNLSRSISASLEEVQKLSRDNVSRISTHSKDDPVYKGSTFAMFICFGIASLTPWNMFITAKDYFHSKFQNSTENIEENFERYFQIGAICADVAASFLTVLLVQRFRVSTIIYFSNISMLLGFIFTTILAKIESAAWPTAFFVITEITFCLIGGSGAMYISAMWGITSSISTVYTEAFLIGMTISGIFASILNIVTLSIPGVDFIAAGFWYFLAATQILLITLILFDRFQRKHFKNTYKPANTDDNDELQTSTDAAESYDTRDLFKRSFCFGYSVFFGLYITFLMFPATMSNLKSSVTNNDVWAKKYFLPVSLFLAFNMGDLVGRFLGRWKDIPGRGLLSWYTTGRVLIVVLLLMCRVEPRRIPYWFNHDSIPTFLIIVLAITGGQVLTLSLRYAPEVVEGKRAKTTVGTIMAFWGAIGRVLGSVSTYLVVLIIE